MRTINRTFSLPEDVDRDLHLFIKPRRMSHFVAESIRKNLEKRRESLAKEYADANKDEGQVEAMNDWACTTSDGLGEDNDW